MSIDDTLSRSGFAQLYMQSAQVRMGDLSEFFRRFEEEHHGNISTAELLQATESAAEVHDYLRRAAAYLAEANARVEENYP